MAIRPLRGAASGVLGMSCGIPHTYSNRMDRTVLAEHHPWDAMGAIRWV